MAYRGTPAPTNLELKLLNICRHGRYRDLASLLSSTTEETFDINTCDHSHFTPLHLAAYYRHTECCRILLSQNEIDINVLTKKEKTPFELACTISPPALDIVALIVEKDPVHVTIEFLKNKKIVINAICKDYLPLLKLFEEHDIDLKIEDEALLMLAFIKNAKNILKYFIEERKFKVFSGKHSDLLFAMDSLMEYGNYSYEDLIPYISNYAFTYELENITRMLKLVYVWTPVREAKILAIILDNIYMRGQNHSTKDLINKLLKLKIFNSYNEQLKFIYPLHDLANDSLLKLKICHYGSSCFDSNT